MLMRLMQGQWAIEFQKKKTKMRVGIIGQRDIWIKIWIKR